MNLLFFVFVLSMAAAKVIYLEEVMDCVENICEEPRTLCGVDSDCRLSY